MNLDNGYLIWVDADVKRSYIVSDIDERLLRETVGPNYKMKRGGPLAGQWPDGMSCIMEDGDPAKPLLPDNLANTRRWLFISKRLKVFFEEFPVPDIEYLPIKLVDEKRRSLTVSDAYFIAR